MKIYKIVFKDDLARFTNIPNLIKEQDIPKAMKYRGGIASLELVGELIDLTFDRNTSSKSLNLLDNTFVNDIEISEKQKEIMKKAMRFHPTIILYNGYILTDGEKEYMYDGNGFMHELSPSKETSKRKNVINLDYCTIYSDGKSTKKYVYNGTDVLEEIK